MLTTFFTRQRLGILLAPAYTEESNSTEQGRHGSNADLLLPPMCWSYSSSDAHTHFGSWGNRCRSKAAERLGGRRPSGKCKTPLVIDPKPSFLRTRPSYLVPDWPRWTASTDEFARKLPVLLNRRLGLEIGPQCWRNQPWRSRVEGSWLWLWEYSLFGSCRSTSVSTYGTWVYCA